ncbi:hypothetical protein [Planomonospora sp. ID82291]|uniref:hypothetical protein n=1 Tax=Planomonospora sp. ID82291 TaxID=2738136 RepID=UPI0018C38162|nr:hypothetical protein [Planomonospora sp. ID82291]MBG0818996.1 hypothetical protein [Planomonospora sp. ID82291]
MDRDLLGDVLFLGIGAVVLWVSFDTLTHLAELAGWSTVWDLPNGWRIKMAWALPVAVDFYAIATARAWLMRRWWISEVTRAHARSGAWWAIGGSIALNSVSHALTMLRYRAESWHGVALAVLIGAVPPVVLAAIAHLRALQNQDRAEATERERARAERLAEQAARRAGTGAGTGTAKAGTGLSVPAQPPVPVPVPASVPEAPVPASPPAVPVSQPPGGTDPTPKPAPTPAPALRTRPRREPQAPNPVKGTTLLSAQDLEFIEKYMADHPGEVPKKRELLASGMGGGRAVRVRAFIEREVIGGTGVGTETAAPAPADSGTDTEAGTASPSSSPRPGTAEEPPAGTAETGSGTAGTAPAGTADTEPVGTESPETSEAPGTELVGAGTGTAINE